MAVLITGIRLMTKTAIVISSTQIHQIQMAMAGVGSTLSTFTTTYLAGTSEIGRASFQ